MLKDAENHQRKLDKGKLSPNDIADYEKDRAKQQERIQELQEKVDKYQKKLTKVRD